MFTLQISDKIVFDIDVLHLLLIPCFKDMDT